MKLVHETYKNKFFRNRKSLSWRAPIVCKTINEVFKPKSVIDVGCGIGDYVDFFNKVIGIKAFGIEGSKACIPYYVAEIESLSIFDLRILHTLKHRSEIVICLEVAEHIEIEYSDIFIQNLIQMSDKIIFSAAPPGQKGHGHFNCQPKKFWINKFGQYKYYNVPVLVDAVQVSWRPWSSKKAMTAYDKNLMVFIKEDS